MKNKIVLTFLTSIFCILVLFGIKRIFIKDFTSKTIKVGFVYIGDTGSAYTNNFYRSQLELEETLGNQIQTIAKYNIKEEDSSCKAAIEELINEGCSLIFTTSFGYGEITKKMAQKYPEVQFCHASGNIANSEPVLNNFHNFMGTIYEGRYISGVIAGLKINELIMLGKVKRNAVKVGYVAAFPYPEVISGYTAFFLGIRSIIGEAEMEVQYTNTWSNHAIEKKVAEKLIDDNCVIISQHSDTFGPAIACEEASSKYGKTVFHVGYNQSMTDVAPTTSLVSSRINWTPYIIGATKAVLKGKKIEKVVRTNLKGNDSAAGIDKGWIEIIGLNKLIAAKGTEETLNTLLLQFKNSRPKVFYGNYYAVNPFDENDVWDLHTQYYENKISSAPTFNYVIKDLITIVE